MTELVGGITRLDPNGDRILSSTQQWAGYECTECGELIPKGDDCVMSSWVTVSNDGPQMHQYGGIYHEDCFEEN